MSEDSSQMRVVFDCMIYLQATISEHGAAAELIRLVDRNALSLFISGEILDEVRNVLSRSKIRERNPEITDQRVEAIIGRLLEKATVLGDISHHFNYARDPKDEKYINLAVEVEAHYIVSRDKDLLDLMSGYTDECKDFRRRFKPLKVIEPVELLKAVASKESKK